MRCLSRLVIIRGNSAAALPLRSFPSLSFSVRYFSSKRSPFEKQVLSIMCSKGPGGCECVNNGSGAEYKWEKNIILEKPKVLEDENGPFLLGRSNTVREKNGILEKPKVLEDGNGPIHEPVYAMEELEDKYKWRMDEKPGPEKWTPDKDDNPLPVVFQATGSGKSHFLVAACNRLCKLDEAKTLQGEGPIVSLFTYNSEMDKEIQIEKQGITVGLRMVYGAMHCMSIEKGENKEEKEEIDKSGTASKCKYLKEWDSVPPAALAAYNSKEWEGKDIDDFANLLWKWYGEDRKLIVGGDELIQVDVGGFPIERGQDGKEKDDTGAKRIAHQLCKLLKKRNAFVFVTALDYYWVVETPSPRPIIDLPMTPLSYMDARKVLERKCKSFVDASNHSRIIHCLAVASGGYARLIYKVSQEVRKRYESGKVCKEGDKALDLVEKVADRCHRRLPPPPPPEYVEYVLSSTIEKVGEGRCVTFNKKLKELVIGGLDKKLKELVIEGLDKKSKELVTEGLDKMLKELEIGGLDEKLKELVIEGLHKKLKELVIEGLDKMLKEVEIGGLDKKSKVVEIEGLHKKLKELVIEGLDKKLKELVIEGLDKKSKELEIGGLDKKLKELVTEGLDKKLKELEIGGLKMGDLLTSGEALLVASSVGGWELDFASFHYKRFIEKLELTNFSKCPKLSLLKRIFAQFHTSDNESKQSVSRNTSWEAGSAYASTIPLLEAEGERKKELMRILLPGVEEVCGSRKFEDIEMIRLGDKSVNDTVKLANFLKVATSDVNKSQKDGSKPVLVIPKDPACMAIDYLLYIPRKDDKSAGENVSWFCVAVQCSLYATNSDKSEDKELNEDGEDKVKKAIGNLSEGLRLAAKNKQADANVKVCVDLFLFHYCMELNESVNRVVDSKIGKLSEETGKNCPFPVRVVDGKGMNRVLPGSILQWGAWSAFAEEQATVMKPNEEIKGDK